MLIAGTPGASCETWFEYTHEILGYSTCVVLLCYFNHGNTKQPSPAVGRKTGTRLKVLALGRFDGGLLVPAGAQLQAQCCCGA